MSWFKNRNNRSKRLVAVHIMPDGVALASASASLIGNQQKLTVATFLSVLSPLDHADGIAPSISAAGLEGRRCSLVLSPGEYQVVLTEAPAVPKEEIKDALLWRVKDMIKYSEDDAIIDYFEIPKDAFQGRRKMLYVVVAERELIDKRIAWLERIGFYPECIDVPEMALLNIAQNLNEHNTETAMLYLNEKQSVINMMSSGNLYLSRILLYNHSTQVDNTVLDLQRSMDYFESQIGKPPCQRIIVMPLQIGETPLITKLSNNLGVDVQPLDLSDIVKSDKPLTIDLQQRCFIAIAAALRSEEER